MYKIISRIFLCVCLVFVLMSTLENYPVGAMLITATRTPTRTSTHTPTSTLTKALSTPTPLTNSFQRLLSWGGGGGGFFAPGVFGEACFYNKKTIKSTPSILAIGDDPTDYGHVCLYGFKPGKQITITFKSPNGKADAVGIFDIGTEELIFGDGSDYLMFQIDPPLKSEVGYTEIIPMVKNDKPITEIAFWKPMGIPEGLWEVTVKSGDVFLKTKMIVGWPKTEPRFGWVYSQPSVLDRPPAVSEHMSKYYPSCQTANSEEKKLIQAINLKPNQYYKFGIYVPGKFDYENGKNTFDFNKEYSMLTNNSGAYQTEFYATQKDKPMTYYVAALFEPISDPYRRDARIDYDCIQVKWKACPNAPYSGLEKGKLRITGNPLDSRSNNIRNKPGSSNNLIGRLQADEGAAIIDGPQCADNMVWWKIKTESSIIGWAAEGQGSEVWLVP
jgi:hypothetical protein